MILHDMNSAPREPALQLSTRPDPIPALTGLRIVGAGWVVLFHFQPTLYEAFPWLSILSPIFAAGDYGVPLFFILSGYIIWHNYGSRSLLAPRASAKFLWRRFARLWPVNFFSQLLAVPLIYWAVVSQGYWGAPIPDWYSWSGLLQSSFMVAGLGHPEMTFPWNQPSWTLTAEMVAYVIFPIIVVLALVVRITRTKHVWIWTLLGLVIAYSFKLVPFQFPYRWIVELLLIFVIGVLLRIGVRAVSVPRIAAVLQIASPVGIALACYTNPYLNPLLLAVWVWSLSSKTGPGVRFFSLRPLQIAGLSSYSLYMLHWILLGYTFILMFYFPQLRDSLLQLVVVLLFILVGVTSWLSWKFFESPARKFVNRGFDIVWRKRDGANATPDMESAVITVGRPRDIRAAEHRPVDNDVDVGPQGEVTVSPAELTNPDEKR